MRTTILNISGLYIPTHSLNTVVIGSGAAGFNAADSLYNLGVRDIAIVTEGLKMGTSRNTGSDKQTYYKLTLAGDTPDSVVEMAQTLFGGGAMHGDIALVEAALSARSFYKLVDIGVPFPHNRFGEYVGYKTDHDPGQRATSAGPLTSRFMTEKLEQQVSWKNIRIFDGYQVIGILTRKENEVTNATGIIALDLNRLEETGMGFTLFNCTNIVYAVGGPAGMYLTSVYPESQTGASGAAFEAGARGINLTESQYGIASIKFRWNLSGTYQQVIPRYVSTNEDGGDEREFLEEYFDEPGRMLDAIFLKGYQWPFDPRKVENFGSSLVDILVYNETQLKGRRVFMDFTRNPSWGSSNEELDFTLLGGESHNYLKNSGALFGRPIDRLAKMNQPAIDLYKNNGIDLVGEYLEIGVCAQHNNGGLLGNIWWESNIRHLFPVGEANGTFGVYRPGGSALNSTQVGSFRAAQYISANYTGDPMDMESFADAVRAPVEEKIADAVAFMKNRGPASNVVEIRRGIQARMTRVGAHIRNMEKCRSAMQECLEDFSKLASLTCLASPQELPQAFKNRDILITQYVYLSAIKEYMEKGGKSRGSYLVQDPRGRLPVSGLPESFKLSLDGGAFDGKVCEVELIIEKADMHCDFQWKPVRPIPSEESWFENIWNSYMNKEIIV